MPVCQKNTASQHEGSSRNQDQNLPATRHGKARQGVIQWVVTTNKLKKRESPAPATPSEQGNEADKKQKRERKES